MVRTQIRNTCDLRAAAILRLNEVNVTARISPAGPLLLFIISYDCHKYHNAFFLLNLDSIYWYCKWYFTGTGTHLNHRIINLKVWLGICIQCSQSPLLVGHSLDKDTF